MANMSVSALKRAIGRRIALECVRLDLTGQDAASRLGCSRRTWCNYEAGYSCPDAVMLNGMHRLGFDLVYIVTGQTGANVEQ